MSVRVTRLLTFCAFALTISQWTPTAQAAPPSLSVYLAAPGILGVPSLGSGVTTTVETFDKTAQVYTSNYSSSLGTYKLSTATAGTVVATDSTFKVQADDKYGSGTGQYMAFGSQSGSYGAVTLQFSAAQSFFGFSWNAGDANNGITFYSGTTQIGRYSTADTLKLLSGSTVTAMNGSTYQTSAYKGKPLGAGVTPTDNTGEPYGYLAFYAASGTTFDRIVFDNSSTTGTGFESDNHTIIASGTPTAQGSFVSVGQVVQPEPGSFALLLPVAVAGIAYRRKRTKAAPKPEPDKTTQA